MSIDINWETLTGGSDGEALAERIRAFIDGKFQEVTLPRFIQSVRVHSFDFGRTCPDLEIKDICDPLPDFYEDEGDWEDGEDGNSNDEEGLHPRSLDRGPVVAAETTGSGRGGMSQSLPHPQQTNHRLQDLSRELYTAGSNYPYRLSDMNKRLVPGDASRIPPNVDTRSASVIRPSPLSFGDQLASPFHSRTVAGGTSGIPGGTSNLSSYFHLPLAGGISGTQTPLAAVAGGTPFSNGWPHDPHQDSLEPSPSLVAASGDLDGSGGVSTVRGSHRYSEVSSNSPSRPSTAVSGLATNQGPDSDHLNLPPPLSPLEHSFLHDAIAADSPSPLPFMHERRTEDLQVMLRVKYSGDVRLSLTAEILLDYPMPSFVGIPLKLNITGLTFDGVAVLAYIRKKAHFCFLAPEDAVALVGGESSSSNLDNNPLNESATSSISVPTAVAPTSTAPLPHGAVGASATTTATTSSSTHTPTTTGGTGKFGGLLQEIKVESEIGRTENGKQVLKNVGKVEKFVLEEVRRIFDEEFVYPSFWTFLV